MLRTLDEYLLSKILTLGVLSLLESLLLVALSRGVGASLGSLVVGLFLALVAVQMFIAIDYGSRHQGNAARLQDSGRFAA